MEMNDHQQSNPLAIEYNLKSNFSDEEKYEDTFVKALHFTNTTSTEIFLDSENVDNNSVKHVHEYLSSSLSSLMPNFIAGLFSFLFHFICVTIYQ